MNTIQMTTLAILAGRWQAEADSGAGSPDRRVALRECADALRMLCEMRFEDCPRRATSLLPGVSGASVPDRTRRRSEGDDMTSEKWNYFETPSQKTQ